MHEQLEQHVSRSTCCCEPRRTWQSPSCGEPPSSTLSTRHATIKQRFTTSCSSSWSVAVSIDVLLRAASNVANPLMRRASKLNAQHSARHDQTALHYFVFVQLVSCCLDRRAVASRVERGKGRHAASLQAQRSA